MAINPKIFKKYDIRGQASGADAVITREAARQVGRVFGTYIQVIESKSQVVVGRDNRESSYDLHTALIDGLRASGVDVIDIGLVATPLVYWHTVHYGGVGGVMITGSHLPADQNGFKLCVGPRPVFGHAIQTLRVWIEKGRMHSGTGKLTVDDGAYRRYVHDLTSRIPAARSLKVVVDAGNGMGGLFGPRLIERWGHEVVARLYCEPNDEFPNHHPNPQDPANMVDLGAAVREHGADIGIAFDGDADRMGAVDEHGEMIAADRLLTFLALDMLKRNPGSAVVADVLCSQVLFDAVAEAGGMAFMAASGHSLVKEAMRDKDALIGGEMSGHIFLAEDYFGYDDGFFATGRLLQWLAAQAQPLSALNAELPTLVSTPEYRPHCPDEQKQAVIDGVAARLRGKGDMELIDGFRLTTANGWGILRASNTEPVLSLRFEGQTRADAESIQAMFVTALRDFPFVDTSAMTSNP
jgi:phosphomannomutase / phosphoglucomutase